MPDKIIFISLIMVSCAVFIAFLRLALGPTLPDRVVAVDLIGVASVGLMVAGAAASGERAFLDAAMVIALVAFLGVVAYARYSEKGNK